jgi:hypothetical protein
MLAADSPSPEAVESTAVDPALKPLLDHIACELAHEYIRLMETAAAAETSEDGEAWMENRQS